MDEKLYKYTILWGHGRILIGVVKANSEEDAEKKITTDYFLSSGKVSIKEIRFDVDGECEIYESD